MWLWGTAGLVSLNTPAPEAVFSARATTVNWEVVFAGDWASMAPCRVPSRLMAGPVWPGLQSAAERKVK